MDLVRKTRKISICLALICCFLGFGCNKKELEQRKGEQEHELYFRIVRFSNDIYKDYVLAGKKPNELLVKGWGRGPWIQDSAYRGGHYIALAKDCYIAEYFCFDPDDVLINKTWSEWSQNEIYFSESDILTTHPYSDFFKVGQYELKADIFPIEERVISVLNAMIEDGSIEKYRVDLGY